jgi:N-acetylglucosaminyldiphosphoundecaprenol N-acetyl-beta-D-mannosaminyltransferase
MNPKPTTIPLLDFSAYSNNLQQLDLSKKTLINTINQYSFCIAQKDAAFKKALQGAVVLFLFGVAITAVTKLLNK